MRTTVSLARCVWITALYLLSPFSFAQNCVPAAATIVTIQGRVEISLSGARSWKAARMGDALCAGQQIRVLRTSRAVLQLPNETLLRLDEGSVFTLRAIEPDKPALLDLLRGALHIISRVPRALNIRTPFVNAGIEGTEFALRVGNAETALWVYEGRVRFSNSLGQLLIASGEAAAAAAGRAPERRIVIKPRQAVEWALYYPPLLDTRPDGYPEGLRPAVLAYRRNDLTAAFAALDGLPEDARDARYHILRAGLLLSVGRVPEAERDLKSAQRLDPKNGTAYALRSVIDGNGIGENQDKRFYRSYLHWAPHPRLALAAEYQFEEFERERVRFDGQPEFNGLPELRTHYLPLDISYFHPSGLFTRLGATYVHQGATRDDLSRSHDRFWTFDAAIGYRLPKRYV